MRAKARTTLWDHKLFLILHFPAVKDPHRFHSLLYFLGRFAKEILIGWTADGLSFFVAVEENIAFILNELAVVVVFPKGLEHGLIRPDVVIADESLEVLCTFWAMVERHFWEKLRS